VPFQHSIAGGQGNLVAGSFQSPNFVSGSAGWQVTRDGDVEFNSGTFRGTVTGGAFQGTNFVITAAGIFFYSGPPAAGNLLIAIANAAGSDPFGNPFGQGVSIVGPNGAVISLEDNGTGAAMALLAAGMIHNTIPPQIFGGSQLAGTAGEITALILSSGKESGNDDAALQLFSASADNTVAARVVIEFGGTIFATINKDGLVLPGNPTPVPVAGSMLLFSDTKGSLRIIDGNDLATYAAERKTLFLSGDSATLTALTTLFGAQNVAAGSYRIHAQLYLNVATAGAEFNFQLTLPAGAAGQVGYTVSRSTSFIGSVTGGVNTSVGAAVSLGAANGYLVQLDAFFTVTATGTMSFQVGSLTATGLVVGQFSTLEIMPV
jgi:hypothetical protein